MGVQLDIKDAATVRLARELAGARGESVTAVIRAALEREMREREAAVRDKARRINAAVDAFRQHLPPEWEGKTSKEIINEIYEDGLPK